MAQHFVFVLHLDNEISQFSAELVILFLWLLYWVYILDIFTYSIINRFKPHM